MNSNQSKFNFASKSFEYITDYDTIITSYLNKKINYRKYTEQKKK